MVCSFGEDEIFYKTLSDKDNKPFPDHYRTMKPGDAVICAFHQYEFTIGKVFSKTEEENLLLCGVNIPEVPPDLHPNGYYG